MVKPRLKYRHEGLSLTFPYIAKIVRLYHPSVPNDIFREIILGVEYRRTRGGNFNILNTPRIPPSFYAQSFIFTAAILHARRPENALYKYII